MSEITDKLRAPSPRVDMALAYLKQRNVGMISLHRLRPVGAHLWSEWRTGKANLGAASGLEWQDVDFVPATEIESLRARVAVLEGALTEIALTEPVPLSEADVAPAMFAKLNAAMKTARRALTPVAETPNQEPAP